LLYAAADAEGSGGTAIEMHCFLHVGVESLVHALQLWRATNLWENLEKVVSTD